MVRRWVIRGLALALLTLCVGAWVGSYWEHTNMGYSTERRWLHVEVECGEAIVGQIYHSPPNPHRSPPWFFGYRVADRQDIQGIYGTTQYHYLGFGLYPPHVVIAGTREDWFAMAPLWFPTLLSALLLWLVWRKTRPTYNGRGFPVEPAGKEATKP